MEKSLPSAAEKRIVIGKAGAPHGVKGEMKIIPMTDFPERFEGMTHCYIGDKFVEIAGVRYHKNHILMTVKGVPLKEGEYYMADILGLSVWDIDGHPLGTVTDILRTGSNDVYVVSLPGRREDILVPALKKVVLEISVEEGKMVVSMPEVVE